MLTIRMRNWYCWGDHTLQLAAPVSFVVGLNGAGKTALRDALEFAFLGTGHLRGAKTKKELASVAIRDDFEDCEVTVEAAGIRIRRTMDREGSQEVWRSTAIPMSGLGSGPIPMGPNAEPRWMEEEPAPLKRDQGNPFGDTPDDLVRCMLEPRHFYTLELQRRQEILVMATTNSAVSQEAVLQVLMRRLDYETKPDLEALQDAAVWVASGGFRAAEDAAIEQRKEAKRERDAVVVGDEIEPMLGDVDLAANPAEAHERKLVEVRSAHTQAVRLEAAGAGAMAGKLAEAEEALVALQGGAGKAVERALELLAEAGAHHQAREHAEPPETTPEPARSAAHAHGITAEATRALEAALATETTAQKAIVDLEAKLGASSEISRPDECPAGPPGMRCAAKPGQWKSCVEAAVEDPTSLAAAVDRLRGERIQAKREVETARQKREKALKAEGLVQEAWATHREGQERLGAAGDTLAAALVAITRREEEVETAQTDRRAELAACERRVEAARLALVAAQQGDQPTGPSVVDLEASIGRGDVVCEASRRYWREVEERNARRAAWEVLEATVGRWDAICQELKPDGIETELGGNAREAFLELLEPARELSGEIFLDSDCAITVALDREGHPKHPLQLSESQALAVGCAIQHALCRQLGFPILLVDGMDRFDGPHRQAWAQLATEVSGGYAGAVLGLATTTGEPKPPGEGFQTLWLKPDGAMVLLGGEGF